MAIADRRVQFQPLAQYQLMPKDSLLLKQSWLLFLGTLLWLFHCATGQAQQTTFCNPINIDYAYCPIPNFVVNGKHRTTADPVIVPFQDAYFLFSTNQWGYWWSEDLLNWTFVPRKFLKPQHQVYDELCAPGAFVMGDALYVIGSTYTNEFALWKSTNPKVDDWVIAKENFPIGAWDPAFFFDEGKLFLYHGSSNTFPLYVQQLDPTTFEPTKRFQELFTLNEEKHGWERFGETHDNVFLKPFLEGAWMNKISDRYYMQYSAPGTEFSGYADGVYTAPTPEGPFTYQRHNPFSSKLGGFIRGAGHGATFQDFGGNWWHVATSTICVKNNFERRISMWPTSVDADGVLACDTSYGDYPWFMGSSRVTSNAADVRQQKLEAPLKQTHGVTAKPSFTGWMLLNYAKPVRVSSTLGSAFAANFAVDEDIKTYWSAATNQPGEYLETDLGEACTVRAIQLNYADQDAELMGKVEGLHHAYRILESTDGQAWNLLIDKSANRLDVPHDYIELPEPKHTRYLRVENLHVPTGKFAISGLRVFGQSDRGLPHKVENFIALRGDSERRAVWLKWKPQNDATGYVVRWGVAADKLYSSVMIYGGSEYVLRVLDRDEAYYFQIEAFNEAGIGDRSDVVRSQ